MSPSNAHSHVTTLEALGYLSQEEASREYRLGLRVTDLNATGLREHVRPYLEELRKDEIANGREPTA